MILLLLAACVDGTEEGSLPSRYVFEDTDLTMPLLSTAGAETAVQAVFSEALDYNAAVLFASYDEMMTLADAACPLHTYPGEGIAVWDTNCTAGSGAEFNGFIYAYESTGSVEVRRVRAEASVNAPDGRRITLAGEAEIEYQASSSSWRSDVSGVMLYDGPAAEGSWMAEGIELSLAYDITAAPGGGLASATFDGAVSGLSGDVSTVSFTDVAFGSGEDWPCEAEPAGSLALRDQNGVWADLVFDVTGDATDGYAVDEALCDGCGTLWYEGESLGQVCIDATAVTRAETPPW